MHNYNHLYYFYVVAKLGGVTAAAHQLNTSQSSLSMQLKTLETQMGLKLLRKEGRGIVLTRSGQSVFGYCRRMFEVANELDFFLEKTDHLGHASLSIGVSPDIERPYVTDVVASTIKSMKASQKPSVTQVSYPHEKLVAKLEMGELDAVISSQPVHSQTVKTLAELKLGVKAVASARLGRSIGAMLENDDIGLAIASQDMRLRWETDEYLVKKKIRKSVSFESNVIGALVRSAIDGLGITFLPEVYLQRELKRGSLVISREVLWTHRLFLMARGVPASDESRQLLATLVRHLEHST